MKTTSISKFHVTNNIVLTFFIVLILFSSCTEIFEPELSEDDVILIAPPDNLTTSELIQTFWWEEVKNAEEYNFQLASPSFMTSHKMIIDTTTFELNIACALSPGSYQWRVAAKNSSSQTNFTTYSFIIDSLSLITNDSIQLLLPLSNDTSNNNHQSFKWNKINSAELYKFNLYYKTNLVYSTETICDTLSVNLSWGDGPYEWEVRGQNMLANTIYVRRGFYIDATAPGIPTLLSPINDLEIYDTIIQFNWNRAIDYASSIHDNILIYQNPELSEIKIDEQIRESQYINYLDPGVYYWRVRSIDAAGNGGLFSQTRKITVKSKSVSSEEVLLMSPLVSDTLNETFISFSWLAVSNAKSYTFNLYFNSNLVYTINSIAQTTEIDLIWGEGSYKWEVKASNDFSSTIYTQREFYVDISAPKAPDLILPINNSVNSDSLQLFIWQRQEDFGSSISDSLYIYNDSILSSIKHKKMTFDTTYEYELEPGVYFWRVRSIDAVGNLGDFSQVCKLTIIADEE